MISGTATESDFGSLITFIHRSLLAINEMAPGMEERSNENTDSELIGVIRGCLNNDGYSHKEIAKLLKIGESSSRTYLSRAKNQLKELYNAHFTGQSARHA